MRDGQRVTHQAAQGDRGRVRTRSAGGLRSGRHSGGHPRQPVRLRHGHTARQSTAVSGREFRRLLEAERRRLLAELEALTSRSATAQDVPRTGVEGGEDDASADAAIHVLERDRDTAVELSLQSLVSEIDLALARVRQGTYGVCVHCHKAISLQRLRAIPYATLCVTCKAEQERRSSALGSVPFREWRVFTPPRDPDDEDGSSETNGRESRKSRRAA